VNSIGKVGGDKIRLKLPLWGIPQIFTFAVAGAHQNTASASAAGQLDVAVAIADDEGTMQVDSVFAGGPIEHSCLRLAAIAAIGGSVRAIVYGVKMGAVGFELLGHEFMDCLHKRFRKILAADARLICYHDNGHSGLIQAANGLRDMRQDTKSADMIQVADFFGDSTVAIEKNSWPERAGFRQGAPRSMKSTVARLLRRRQP
jgi:hypothetical protein